MNNWSGTIKGFARIARDALCNTWWNRSYDLFYVIENADWSIKWDGEYITRNLNALNLLKSKVIVDPVGLRNRIIHFGSENTLISKNGIRTIHPSNKTVFTWFHVSPGDERTAFIPDLNKKVAVVHTSCEITRQKLISFGLKDTKVKVVPLGVDLRLFKKAVSGEKDLIREELGIPSDRIVIGSFQKDGDGWGEGMKPKLIKGPDIFCDVCDKLHERYNIHVLLTGPARGYVKKRLERAGIPFTHQYLREYTEIARYYRALDLYIVASRAEGGPKAILEAMASGIPVVSTKVGMAPEVIKDRTSGMLAGIDNVEELLEESSNIIDDQALRDSITENGIKRVKEYDWPVIAREYYEKVYKPLLK